MEKLQEALYLLHQRMVRLTVAVVMAQNLQKFKKLLDNAQTYGFIFRWPWVDPGLDLYGSLPAQMFYDSISLKEIAAGRTES